MTVVPPELEHADSGFWKSQPPGAVGEDEAGNAIVGKTLGRTYRDVVQPWASRSS